MRSILFAAGLATAVQAYTKPTTATWGPLLTPDLSHPVTQGQTFQVTWDPSGHSTDVTVSLVLCHGSSSNCVTSDSAIAEGIPAGQKSYSWAVPCSLSAGTQSTDTGYGMLIIVDGTGEFQYSTQFSVLSNPTCGSSDGSNGRDGSSSSGWGSTTISAANSTATSGWSSSAYANSTTTGGRYNTTTTAASTSIVHTTMKPSTAASTTTRAPVSTTVAATSAVTSAFNAAGRVGVDAAAFVVAGVFAMFAL